LNDADTSTAIDKIKGDQFSVRFWGVRGSIACAGPEVQRYGGNTSCLEVMCGDRQFIFDAGTGLRYLGETFTPGQTLDVDLFLTHTHLDHVMGLPFFQPLYSPSVRCRIWSGHLSNGMTTHEALQGLMNEPLFPVAPEVFHADVEYLNFAAGDALAPADGVEIMTARLNHPNGATGYRVNYKGRSIVYATDTEHQPGALDREILTLIEGADLFIYDATYTDQEYDKHKGFGHSTWQEGARLADAAGVKTYVVFHHDPAHDDEFMDVVAAAVEAERPGSVVAKEGMVLQV
jgi:phosphoribosyl 1,2-cyclic phosphodiesterase